jgi:hypothetical protein
VLLVSSHVSEAALEGKNTPVYHAADLDKLTLFNPSPEALCLIRESKEMFGGWITAVWPMTQLEANHHPQTR